MPDSLHAVRRDPPDVQLADEGGFGCHGLRSGKELRIDVLPNGCVYAIERNGILINQLLASPLAGGIHRIYLRVHGADGLRFAEIVGPGASSGFASSSDRLVWSGSWDGFHYHCTYWLHPSGESWFFHVEIENRTAKSVRCDAVMVQDLGLASREQIRNNEIFTSQYLDHFATQDAEAGFVLMTRQNLAQASDTHPWLLQGCYPRAAGFTTDGFDFFGVGHKRAGVPAALLRAVIGDRVRQSEAAYVAIQADAVVLEPSASDSVTFFCNFSPDHPEPSSRADTERLRAIRAMRDEMVTALAASGRLAVSNENLSLFQTCERFRCEDLEESDIERCFPANRRHVERRDGELLSFFSGDASRHVVLAAKELSVGRPHGHILRSGVGLMPDAALMSCTCYAAGVFASHLSLGNSSVGQLLSRVRDPLNIVRSGGLRIFVRDDPTGAWQLLGVPSAFEMALDECRWHYKRGVGFLTVSCIASEGDPAISIEVHIEGSPLELLISGEIAAGPAEYESSPRLVIERAKTRFTIQPDPKSLLGTHEPGIVFHIVTPDASAVEAIGGDEMLLSDNESRGLPYLAMQTRPTRSFRFTVLGTLGDTISADALCRKYENHDSAPRRGPEAASRFWNRITAGARVTFACRERADQIQDALAWFARDAVIHLATPRGLEQPNGGAWGVRDVCQGPVEFLLSYNHCDVVADIIRRLFAQQYERRGDWPQWFMFPPFHRIQSNHAHGDVVIWPLKALCDYLEHTNDAAILHERLPYTDDETMERTDRAETILEHADRALQRMRQQFLPGLSLPRYGDGDWDDSLQPADPLLRERMVSAWTTALMCQTVRRYAVALSRLGFAERAAATESLASGIEGDFRRHLMPDGVAAGFAVFGKENQPVEYLLHPSDTRTGMRYRLISMTRGILSGLFTNEQADAHLDLIREHLLFPDGARLMDRPATYRGGTERTFRRAESASFFGREIGLQYVHAHLRYAEALAMMGRADELWRALLVVNPIAVTQVVPNARPRQRNCYFSSSDAAFADRYEASRDFEKLRRGEVPVEGGWRIYSSGPGIYTSLVVRHLFGLRRYFDCVEFDPVLPHELDGAAFDLVQDGRRVRYQYSVKDASCGPKRVIVNGSPCPTLMRIASPYRTGGVRIPSREFDSSLKPGDNLVQIDL